MKAIRFLVLLSTMFVCGQARAVLPESGLYWNAVTPGLGWYLEIQGDTLVMIAYAHDVETEEPLFYSASGKIVSDDSNQHAYRFEGSLYRFERGPCITCIWTTWDTSEHAQRVGEVMLYLPGRNYVYMELTMDNGRTKHDLLQRYKFGRPFYNLPYAATDSIYDRYLSDLRGDWLFVDKSTEDRTVWQFTFSEVEFPVSFSGTILGQDYTDRDSVVFRDESRNSALVCISYGCGLIQDGTTLASFRYFDVAQDSMFGYMTPADPDADYETGHHVVGVRVPDLTPEIPAPEPAQ